MSANDIRDSNQKEEGRTYYNINHNDQPADKGSDIPPLIYNIIFNYAKEVNKACKSYYFKIIDIELHLKN